MNINLHIHDHSSYRNDPDILETLLLIIKNQKTIMADLSTIQAQNTALIAAVAAEDTVIGSAVTLIDGFGKQLSDLQAELAAAIAANDPAAIQAVADSMATTVTDISAQSTALSAAVTANTPAATPSSGTGSTPSA